MAKLLMSLRIGGNRDAAICVSRPSQYVRSIFGEPFETGLAQKFIWYPDFALFFPPGRLGSYWTEIYVVDAIELQPEAIRSIVVPFTIRWEFEPLLISNIGGGDTLFYLGAAGNYQLLFEARYLTVNEASRLAGFEWYTAESETPQTSAPELIRLTVIPTDEEIQPQILRAEAGFQPPQALCLNSAYEEPPQRTDVPLVLSSHITPQTLAFVDVFEQTLQEFYQIDRPRTEIRRASALGDPENPLWVEVNEIDSVLPFSISIKRNGGITLGEIAWGSLGQIKYVIWQLKHSSEQGFEWESYHQGLIRQDADELQRLLLLLKEKAQVHF